MIACMNSLVRYVHWKIYWTVRSFFLVFFFVFRFIRARLAKAYGWEQQMGPLGNNRQGNEHSEMAHLIAPLWQYIDSLLRWCCFCCQRRTTRLPDIIELQELTSTYITTVSITRDPRICIRVTRHCIYWCSQCIIFSITL